VEPSRYDWKNVDLVSVKGVVFPFKKFPEADSILGPEMTSTGESMGRGEDFPEALLKAFISSHHAMPKQGEVFLSLRDKDKEQLLPAVKQLLAMGYTLSATQGTADFLSQHQLPCVLLKKVHEGRPHCVDHIRSGDVALVINTTTGRTAIEASFGIRRSCIDFSIPCITESDVAEAFVLALKRQQTGAIDVSPLPTRYLS
jgi:carbamoyl-phosphate synthase large subunit